MTDDSQVPLPQGHQHEPPRGAMFDLGFHSAPKAPLNWQPPGIEDLQKTLTAYEVTAFVARGGMGAVYKGVHRALKRIVAIKVLPPEIEQGDADYAERFKREAQAMAQLSHPGIVAVHDAGETSSGLLYFVMEFIEGSDVAQLLVREGRLDPSRALKIAADVLDALAFAHEEGIIHRDIKPSNVMLDRRGRVKVADFGLAKVITQDSAGFTRSDLALGSADFIAPEAMIPGTQLDARADLFAVGVMLYQMLTGKIPRGSFDPPSGIIEQLDPRLDATVLKAMKTDREKRYGSASKMKEAVEALVQGSAGTPDRTDDSGHIMAKPTRVPLIAIALVVIALAASGFIYFTQSPSPPVSASPALTASPSSRSEAEALKLAGVSPPAISSDRWVKVFPDLSILPGLADLNNGWARMKPEAKDLRLRDAQGREFAFTNGGIRVRFRRDSIKSPTSAPCLSLRGDARSDAIERVEFLYFPQTNGLDHLPALKLGYNRPGLPLSARSVGTEYFHEPVPDGGEYTMELYAIGRTIIGRLNEHVVTGTVTSDAMRAGNVTLFSVHNGDFRDIEVINLDGLPEAEALKLVGVSSPPSPPVSPVSSSASTILWHDWLADTQSAGKMPPQLSKEAGGWRIKETNSGSGAYARFNAHVGSSQLRDAAIRVTYVPLESDPGRQAFLSVRQDSDRRGWRVSYNIGESRWVLDTVKDRASTDLLALPPMPELLSASREPRTIELRMVGDTLSFYYNGTLLGSTHDATPATGYVGFSGPPGMLIQKVEWADLSGLPEAEALKLAGVSSTPSPPVSKSSAAYPVGKWAPVWPDPKDIPNLGTVTDGWALTKPDVQALRIPGIRLWNGGLRARFRADKSGPTPQLMLRDPGGSGYNVFCSSSGIAFRHSEPKAPQGSVVLAKFDCPMPRAGEDWLLEFVAVGHTLIARLNGQTFTHALTVAPSTPEPGDLRLYQVDVNSFRDVEVLNLDGLPEAEALKLAGADSSQPTDVATARKWQDYVHDASLRDFADHTEAEAGGIRLLSGGGGVRGKTNGGNGAMRIVTTFPAVPMLFVRGDGGDMRYQAMVSNEGKSVSLACHSNRTSGYLSREVFYLPKPLEQGQEYQLELRAVGTTLLVLFNGQLLGQMKDTNRSAGDHGVLYNSTPALLKSAGYLDLDGLPEAEALRLAGVIADGIATPGK